MLTLHFHTPPGMLILISDIKTDMEKGSPCLPTPIQCPAPDTFISPPYSPAALYASVPYYFMNCKSFKT